MLVQLPLVSVIVPVYNSSQWLKECLQSLHEQTLSNIEILCINDGSTDNSREIIKNYMQLDNRFFLVDSRNNGVTNARKIGINKARGKYIGFVDSDDYVTKDFFEKLYDAASHSDADIAIATRQLRFSETEKNFFYCGKEIININNVEDRISYLCSGILWNKIYKREFAQFIANKYYISKYKICEDNTFTFFAIILAKKIITINSVCYFYRLTPYSITRKKISIEDVLEIYNAFKYILNEIQGIYNKNNTKYKKVCFELSKKDTREFNKYKKITKFHQRKDCFSKIKEMSLIESFLINTKIKDISFTINYLIFIVCNKFRAIKETIIGLTKRFYPLLLIKNNIKKILIIYKAKKNGNYFDASQINFRVYETNFFTKNITKNSPEIIVSLTSYPERIKQAYYTLYSLVHQNMQPNKIELWLSKEEFNGSQSLPYEIFKLSEYGVQICWTNHNIKSYKKIIPAVINHPDSIIITADDDIYYHKNWLSDLYNAWNKNRDLHVIPCHRMHKIILDKNVPLPYEHWLHAIHDVRPHIRHLATGCGGVLQFQDAEALPGPRCGGLPAPPQRQLLFRQDSLLPGFRQ